MERSKLKVAHRKLEHRDIIQIPCVLKMHFSWEYSVLPFRNIVRRQAFNPFNPWTPNLLKSFSPKRVNVCRSSDYERISYLRISRDCLINVFAFVWWDYETGRRKGKFVVCVNRTYIKNYYLLLLYYQSYNRFKICIQMGSLFEQFVRKSKMFPKTIWWISYLKNMSNSENKMG